MQWVKLGRLYSVKCFVVVFYFDLYRRGAYKSSGNSVARK
jgi:hypothetical protein